MPVPHRYYREQETVFVDSKDRNILGIQNEAICSLEAILRAPRRPTMQNHVWSWIREPLDAVEYGMDLLDNVRTKSNVYMEFAIERIFYTLKTFDNGSTITSLFTMNVERIWSWMCGLLSNNSITEKDI